jgi:nucleoside-diphosphate-sugar epimerase
MKILVTGAAGFLGARLIRTLLSPRSPVTNVTSIVAADLAACPIDDNRLHIHTGSITDAAFIDTIAERDVHVVFHLAAVLSGQSEAEFDVGMRVNVDATRMLLEAFRKLGTRPRFVFASSVAVFGGTLPDPVPDDMALWPQSSYGTEKAIAELLVSDYSRRRFVDGIICRLPTVAIRPGKPNSALSSFVSGIIREPLVGVESLCPVPLDTPLWITSPDIVIGNLIHAARLETSRMEARRAVNLPGITTTPAEMLASLERLAGAQARRLVRCELDHHMMTVVLTWPGNFDITRPLSLGFSVDRSVEQIVQQYMDEHGLSDASYRRDSVSGLPR